MIQTAPPVAPALAGPPAATPAQDQLRALQRHFQQCQRARGRWFAAALLAERAHGLMAPRLTTTVAVAGLAFTVVLHWL